MNKWKIKKNFFLLLGLGFLSVNSMINNKPIKVIKNLSHEEEIIEGMKGQEPITVTIRTSNNNIKIKILTISAVKVENIAANIVSSIEKLNFQNLSSEHFSFLTNSNSTFNKIQILSFYNVLFLNNFTLPNRNLPSVEKITFTKCQMENIVRIKGYEEDFLESILIKWKIENNSSVNSMETENYIYDRKRASNSKENQEKEQETPVKTFRIYKKSVEKKKLSL